MKTRNHLLLRAGVSATALSFAVAAHAQTTATPAADPAPASATATATPTAAASSAPGDNATGEVIVTGQFRKERIEHTPLSITALSDATLESKNIVNLRDIAPTVPGLYLAPAPLTHSTASYFIRGIGESDSIANQTVVTYVDDVYTARPIGGSFELNDIDNIQVLRGPQGTLYGRNSSAGAIVVTTTMPTDTPTGFAEVGGGDHNAFTARAGISGPLLANVLDGSLSFVDRQRQGLTYDATTHSYVGDIDSLGVRGKLSFKPTSWASFLLTGSTFRDNSDPTPLVSRLTPGLTPNTDPDVNYSNVRIYNRTRLNAFSLRQTYDLGKYGTLESISAESDFKQPGLYDQDGSVAQINETYSNHRDRDWSQEFRYIFDGSRLHVSSGVFLLYDNFRSYRTNYSPTATSALLTSNVDYYTPPLPAGAAPGHTSLQSSGEVTQNAAVFGQATYDITSKLHLTVGERYTAEEHNFVFTGNTQVNPSVPSSPYLNQIYTIHEPYHVWTASTPKVDVDYNFTSNITGYAYYAEGFKAGGFDGRAPTILDAEKPYNPEYDHTWEVGLKTQLLDRRLTANLALFHNMVDGYQATTTDINLISHRINLGQVRTQGFELETSARPIDGLTWINNLSYLDTSILSTGSDAAAVVAGQITGKQIPYAPRWQYYSSADYELPVNFHGTYHLGAEYMYKSVFYVDLPNTKAAAGAAQQIVNLSASYRPDNTHWDLSFNVSNVFDARFQQGGLVGNGITTADATTYNDPRLFFAKVRYTY